MMVIHNIFFRRNSTLNIILNATHRRIKLKDGFMVYCQWSPACQKKGGRIYVWQAFYD
jgi:hypothetical protein